MKRGNSLQPEPIGLATNRSSEVSKKRRPPMTSAGSAYRTIEINISAQHLMAALYATGTVSDNEEIQSINMKDSILGQTLRNQMWVEDTVVPLVVKLKKGGVSK